MCILFITAPLCLALGKDGDISPAKPTALNMLLNFRIMGLPSILIKSTYNLQMLSFTEYLKIFLFFI